MPQKRKHFSYKVDSYLQDKFLASRTRQRRELCCCGGTEGCVRTWNHARFLCVCSLSLLQVVGPWVLSISEVVSVLLIYFLATSRSLIIHENPRVYHFSYFHSLEDVVGMSCSRAVLLSAAFAAGVQHMHRPYLYASYLLAAAVCPYVLIKILLFRYSQDAVPAAAIFTLATLYCWLHVFAARRTVEWAKRRHALGLGFSSWEDDFGGLSGGSGEDRERATGGSSSGWSLLKRSDSEDDLHKPSCCKGAAFGASFGGAVSGGLGRGSRPPSVGAEDVPPETLAEEDSKFLQLGSIKVHYKEFVPGGRGASQPGESESSQAGIVLVHGFGAGVFAWRHVLEPLALQCHCRVVAFDRPAFGLTSRPAVRRGLPNPYTLDAQARLLLSVCRALGLTRVLLVGHADGCLLALRAVAMASRHGGGLPSPRSRSPQGHPLSAGAVGLEVWHQSSAGGDSHQQELVDPLSRSVSRCSGTTAQASPTFAGDDGCCSGPRSLAGSPETPGFAADESSHGGAAAVQQRHSSTGGAVGSTAFPMGGAAAHALQLQGSGFGSSFQSGGSLGRGGSGVLVVPAAGSFSKSRSPGGVALQGGPSQGGAQPPLGGEHTWPGSAHSASLMATPPSAWHAQAAAAASSLQGTQHGSSVSTASGQLPPRQPHNHPPQPSPTTTTASDYATPASSVAFLTSLSGSTSFQALPATGNNLRNRLGNGSGGGSSSSSVVSLSMSHTTSTAAAASAAAPTGQGAPPRPISDSNTPHHHHHHLPHSIAGYDHSAASGSAWSRLSEATLPSSTLRSEDHLTDHNSLISNTSLANDDANDQPISLPGQQHGALGGSLGGMGPAGGAVHVSASVPARVDVAAAAAAALPPLAASRVQQLRQHELQQQGALAGRGSCSPGGVGGPMSATATAAAAAAPHGRLERPMRHRRVQSTPPVPDGRPASNSSHVAVLCGAEPHGGMLRDPPELQPCSSSQQPAECPNLLGGEQGSGAWPQVLGLGLLHPNLSGTQGPALSRLLASSRLGRSILRPLLRSELGEVANRRAWHNHHKLTQEVLELYKAPLRVEGWCESLIETTRLRKDQAQGDLPAYLAAARQLPALILTGEHDRVVPPAKAELLNAELPGSQVSVVRGCGHLSHEEVPEVLLAQLVPFCADVLSASASQP